MLKSEIDIENLPAGPEIDELIEVEIFEKIPLTEDEWMLLRIAWRHSNPSWSQTARPFKVRLIAPRDESYLIPGSTYELEWPRPYSSSDWPGTAANNYLVQKMRRAGWLFDLADFDSIEEGKIVKLAGFQKGAGGFEKGPLRGEASADTDELAIARAALIAVREEKRALASASA